MRLAAARRPEQDHIGAGFDPAVAGGERHDLGLADGGHGVEVEAVEGFSQRQARLVEMTLDAAAVAFGDLVIGEAGQEACGGPAFLVGTGCEVRPGELDGGKPQIVEGVAETGRIDRRCCGLHAASPTPEVQSSS